MVMLATVMSVFGGVTMFFWGGCDIFLYPARMFNPFFMNLYSQFWTHQLQGGGCLNGAQKNGECLFKWITTHHDGTWKQNHQNRVRCLDLDSHTTSTPNDGGEK